MKEWTMTKVKPDMELTYNHITKQHGFKSLTRCPYCKELFELNTMDKDLFNKVPCLECFMKGYSNA